MRSLISTDIAVILARLGLLLALGGLAVIEAAFSGARTPRAYAVGSYAINYDASATGAVFPRERIQVLAPDLEEARGIIALDCAASDKARCLPRESEQKARAEATSRHAAPAEPWPACDAQLLVLDAWEGLNTLCVKNHNPRLSASFVERVTQGISDWVSWTQHGGIRMRVESQARLLPVSRVRCPEGGTCLSVEHGGLALAEDGDVLAAEPHHNRVTVFNVGNQWPGEPGSGPELIGRHAYSAPGSAVIHDVTTLPDNSLAVIQSSEATPHLRGVFQVRGDGSAPTPIASATDVTRPVGVWYSHHTGRLYVTDASETEQRWMYFQRENGGWSAARGIWTTQQRSTPPMLRHMVTGWTTEQPAREVLFSAGPDGLYVIDPAGILLAKYVVGRPISGVDWGASRDAMGNDRAYADLYLTSGRYIGVLRVAARPRTDPTTVVFNPSPAPPAPPPTAGTLKPAGPAGDPPGAGGDPPGTKTTVKPRRPAAQRPKPAPCSCPPVIKQ